MIYTNRQITSGILTASLLGTMLAILAITVGTVVEHGVIAAFGGPPMRDVTTDTISDLFGAAFGLSIFAIPLSFLLCMPAGYIIVHTMNLRRNTHIARFALAGAIAALVISLLGTAFFVVVSAEKHINSQGMATLTRWGRAADMDGIKTSFGWWVEAYLTLRFMLIGALAGIAARLIIGPPTAPE
jgi:hypothetical protein